MNNYFKLKRRVSALEAQCNQDKASIRDARSSTSRAIHNKVTSLPALGASFACGFSVGGVLSRGTSKHKEKGTTTNQIKSALFFAMMRKFLNNL